MDSLWLKFWAVVGGLCFPSLLVLALRAAFEPDLGPYQALGIVVVVSAAAQYLFARWRFGVRKVRGLVQDPSDRKNFEGSEVWFRFSILAGISIAFLYPIGVAHWA